MHQNSNHSALLPYNAVWNDATGSLDRDMLTYRLDECLYEAAAWCGCHAACSCAVDYLIYKRPGKQRPNVTGRD